MGVTQFQRLDPVMDVPAAIQGQAPTIKTGQGAVNVCQVQCLDRVVNVPVAIRQERSIARMCCSSRVSKEHCGRPCCVATTSACDSEVQKTVDVPQVKYTQELDLDDYSIAENTRISFPLRANQDVLHTFHTSGFSSALYSRSLTFLCRREWKKLERCPRSASWSVSSATPSTDRPERAVAATVQLLVAVDIVLTEQTLPWRWENFTSWLSTEWMATHTVPCEH